MIATISEILTLKLVTDNSVLRHIDFEYVVIAVSKNPKEKTRRYTKALVSKIESDGVILRLSPLAVNFHSQRVLHINITAI